MGNQVTNGRPSEGTGKVILSDGTVHKYDKPLTVAELMLEHPQQVVVEFDQSIHTTTKRPKPLPADKILERNKFYVMLPARRGGKAGAGAATAILSSEEARRILFKANEVLKSKTLLSSYTGFLPLFAKMCPAGGNGSSAVENYLKGNNNYLVEKSQEMWRSTGLFNEVLEEEHSSRPDFLSRQFSGKNSWKPSLDTITEKSVKAKIRHWLL